MTILLCVCICSHSICVTDFHCQRIQEQNINRTLDKAEGFVGTTDQDRFDECEGAVNSVLQDIRRVAQQCKVRFARSLPASVHSQASQPVLTKTKYYQAIGNFVNVALNRILNDILALSDITEQESHKLSEVCHILNAFEGLFVEDHSQVRLRPLIPLHSTEAAIYKPSFVVAYVPSWLKFSYLSELLVSRITSAYSAQTHVLLCFQEASIADISYLFEEGALVDFDIDELVNLVRSLFSDTPLRANTINKLMRGHPPVVS